MGIGTNLRRTLTFLLSIVAVVIAIGFSANQSTSLWALAVGIVITLLATLGSVALERAELGAYGRQVKKLLRATGLVVLGAAAGYAIATERLTWEIALVLAIVLFSLATSIESRGMNPKST